MIKKKGSEYFVTIKLENNSVNNQELIASISNWSRSNEIYCVIIEYGSTIQFNVQTQEQAVEAVMRFA